MGAPSAPAGLRVRRSSRRERGSRLGRASPERRQSRQEGRSAWRRSALCVAGVAILAAGCSGPALERCSRRGRNPLTRHNWNIEPFQNHKPRRIRGSARDRRSAPPAELHTVPPRRPGKKRGTARRPPSRRTDDASKMNEEPRPACDNRHNPRQPSRSSLAMSVQTTTNTCFKIHEN